MQYIKITHAVLHELRSKSYNVLTTESTSEDDNPKFIPQRITDLWEYLDSLDGELSCAVIEDLLKIKEDELKGTVLILE